MMYEKIVPAVLGFSDAVKFEESDRLEVEIRKNLVVGL